MYQYLTVEEAYRITNDLGICLVCVVATINAFTGS